MTASDHTANSEPDEQTPNNIAVLVRKLLCLPENWDLPPELGFLYASDGPEGRLRAQPIEIPELLWGSFPIAPAIDLLTATVQPGDPLRTLLRGLIESTPGWCGIYLTSEGWEAPRHMAEEMVRRDQAGGSVGRFDDLPGAEEVRMISVACTGFLGANAGIYLGRLRRSDNDIIMLSDNDDQAHAGGQVVEALTRLMTALEDTPTRKQ